MYESVDSLVYAPLRDLVHIDRDLDPRWLHDAVRERLRAWHRPSRHFGRSRAQCMNDALDDVPRSRGAVVAGAIRQAFIQPDRQSAGETRSPIPGAEAT